MHHTKERDAEKLEAMLNFINDYFEEYCYSPKLEVIAERLSMVKSTAYRYLIELQSRGLIHYERGKITTDKITKMQESGTKVALVGSIACGLPTLEEENVEEYFTLPEKIIGSGKFFLLRAVGDSMVNAGIDSGDLVLVRQQESARNGEIIVALTNGENTLKRLYKKNNQVILHPENPDYDDIIVKDCSIQGVVIKVLKDVH